MANAPMTNAQISHGQGALTPLTTPAEAQAFAADYVTVMDQLIEVIEQETELVRASKLMQAAKLAETKTDLARRYITDTLRLRGSQVQLTKFAPQVMEELARHHNKFRALLQINLTVLATAHAVSEGIVRGVSDELNRKSQPQTYGASGRANVPDLRTAPPLAVSRSL